MAGPTLPQGILPAPGQPAAMVPGEYRPTKGPGQQFGQQDARKRGIPRVIVVPNPSAGADWSYSVSGPTFYVFHCAVMTLQTSAAAATRIVRAQLKFGSIVCGQFAATATQLASLTNVYSLHPSAISSGDAATIYIPLPSDLIIRDGMSIGTNTTALQAADQWSLIALFMEEFGDVPLVL